MEVQQTQAEKQRVMVPVNPTALDTPSGLVFVWGFEHVSAKMLDVLKTILSHDAFEITYHGIKSVVFRIDGYPKENGKNVCANFSHDTGGIAINMQKTLERAIDRSIDHPENSLFASWWIEMILNFGHEIHHGVRWDTDRDKLYGDDKAIEEEEERATVYCDDLIRVLAQDCDIEMPSVEEEIWFNDQISELFNGKDDNDEWAKSQKEMLIEKVVWRHEPKDSEAVVLHTFKDLICLITNGDIESEEWNKPTIHLNPNTPTLDEQLNGKKVTMNAAGEQGEIIQPSPAPSAANPAPVNEECAFINEMEDYSDVYGPDGEEYLDDYNPVAQPLAPAVQPAAQPAAAKPAFPFDNQPAQPTVNTEAQYDMAVANRIIQGVYMKMYDFIFRNCGHQKDSSVDISFTNPEAVLTTYLPLTEEERSIVVSMDHMDVNGRWCPGVSTKDGLLGKVMKNAKLPAYEIALNVNGAIHRRLFIPQNHNKRNNGVLSQRAMEARSGDSIAYIKNSDTDTWVARITNGEYSLSQNKS